MVDPLHNSLTPPLVVGFVSLGCPKNLVDGERMLASLALEEFVITGDLDAANIGVVNTCAFIDEARAESGEVIAELVERKLRGDLDMVVVAGCYPQLDRDEILDRWPEVDAVVGIAGREELGRLIREVLDQGDDLPVEYVPPLPEKTVDDRERLRLTPRHFAYLRISEGCNNCCSYCQIPTIRGPLKSKPVAAAVVEAKELVADGAVELVIIGQDTTAYGQDFKRRTDISTVLRKLDAVEGLRWLRLLYTHPASFSDALINAYGLLEHLLPYVDLPLQHIAQGILDSMGRRTTTDHIRKLITALRGQRSDMVLRTSFIVGYPGETEEQFEELLDFVREIRFDRLGAFAYSPENGTRAATMPGHVPPEVRAERLDRLMTLQREISTELHRRLIGTEAEVLVDHGSCRTSDAPAVGRIWSQASDIDGVTHVLADGPLKAGDLVRAKIVTAGPYDLEARAVGQ